MFKRLKSFLYGNSQQTQSKTQTKTVKPYILKSLTQKEIDYGRTQSSYLVLNKDTKVQYPLTLKLPNNTTFDSTAAHIDCYPDPKDPKAHNTLFEQNGTENTTFKFGKVTGDRYKRDFQAEGEVWNEGTYLVRALYGATGIDFSIKESIGFMGDTFSTNQYGKAQYAFDPIFKKRKDGKYATEEFKINPEHSRTIAIYGGVGFTRFPAFKNAVLRFRDRTGKIIEDRKTAYLKHETLPIGTDAIEIIVEGNDNKEDARNFGVQLVAHPAGGVSIHDSYIRDHHRGGLSNLSNDAKVYNCIFENTALYSSKPQFPDTTRYAIDLEDAVSNKVEIEKCTFKGRFHSILIAACNELIVKNCTFFGNVYNIYLYQIQKGVVTDCTFEGGHIDGSNNMVSVVRVHKNKFNKSVFVNIPCLLTEDNVFTGGNVTNAGGQFRNNKITGVETSWGDFRNMFDNTFTDCSGYLMTSNQQKIIIDRNVFINHTFMINDSSVLEANGATFKKGTWFRKTITNGDLLFTKCTFEDDSFIHSLIYGGQPDLGRMVFTDCLINRNVNKPFIISYNNDQNNQRPNRMYFKNCTINSTVPVDFITIEFWGHITELVFEKCKIGKNVKLPPFAKIK